MDVNTITAFIAGVFIPVVIALFGREAIGKWLMAGQIREATALEALVQIASEAVSGWRESSSSMAQLVSGLELYKVDADQVRDRIYQALQTQGETLHQLETRLITLVAILSDDIKHDIEQE